jgi:hypothetical protein
MLPLVLLGLQFSLKFLIDRRATAYNFLTALLEIPISIFFLSLSLLAAFIIAGKGDIQFAFVFFISILVLLVFCIFFWRRSIEHFEKENFFYSVGLGILNLLISLPILIYIIYFLINNAK